MYCVCTKVNHLLRTIPPVLAELRLPLAVRAEARDIMTWVAQTPGPILDEAWASIQLPWRVGGLQLRLQDCLADVAYTAAIFAAMHDRAATPGFQSLQYMETHLRHGRPDAPVPAVKRALDSWRAVGPGGTLWLRDHTSPFASAEEIAAGGPAFHPPSILLDAPPTKHAQHQLAVAIEAGEVYRIFEKDVATSSGTSLSLRALLRGHYGTSKARCWLLHDSCNPLHGPISARWLLPALRRAIPRCTTYAL